MKQVLYIEIDEEVTSIFDRVKPLKQKKVHLMVPRKALLFQSIVNLKILKKKLQSIDKQVVIVTSDYRGAHLAKQAGLKVMSSLDFKQVKAVADDSNDRLEPIQARRNEVTRDNPKRFTEKKMTIRELVEEFRLKKKKSKASDEPLPGMTFMRPSRKLLGIIILLSVGLFMLISYIALPGATISIKPTFDDVSHTVNVTLADKRRNQNLLGLNRANVIASEIITIEIKQTKIFNTANTKFEGENAEGQITVVNSTDEVWTLKEETRFQTDDGVIFRIQRGVEVPAATRNQDGELVHGEITVDAIADPFDVYGEPVGERGNIEPTRMTIPGLTKYNQRLVWGRNDKPMTGGVTAFEKVVTEEDIESAKNQMEDSLILLAREELRVRLKEMNELNHTNLALLDDRRYLKTKVLDMKVSEDLLGSSQEKFEVFARIEAQGVAYDAEQLLSLLKQELIERSHPDRQIRESSISPDTITYEVISEDEDLGQIKITATIAGIEEYVIDPEKEAGKRFGQSLKGKIVGMPIREAENLIHNLPEVSDVSIKVWPIWIDTIPRIEESIEIRLMDS